MTNCSDSDKSQNENALENHYDALDTNLTHFFSDGISLDSFSLGKNTESDGAISNQFDELLEHDVEQRYNILDKIDGGGMKDIWRADDCHTDRSIAIAVINDETIASHEKYEAFVREARLTANLQHPNIVPIYDVSLDRYGSPYFTMKALKGETLERIVGKIVQGDERYVKRFTRLNLLTIFQKICDAIAYAHSKGVVHLDLKPSNIIVCDYGEVQVIDWGISQFVAGSTSSSVNHVPSNYTVGKMASTHTICKVAEISGAGSGASESLLVGSPGYMSPEQICAGNTVIDHHSDIYSLGAILFFILTGSKPVAGDTAEELLENTVAGNYISMQKSKMAESVPHVLEAVTMKALAHEKDKRYQSIGMIQDELNNYIEGFATIAESANFITHFQLLVKRHKLAAGLITAFITILTIVVTVGIVSIRREQLFAEEQRIKAEAARKDAVEHLHTVQEKSNYIASLTKQVAPLCQQAAYRYYLDNAFDQFAESLDLAFVFDPSREYVWNHKIHQLTAEQRFNEVMALLKKRTVPFGIIWESYADLESFAHKKNDSEKLQTKDDILQFVEVISRFKRDYYLRYIFHEMNQAPFDPEIRLPIIKELLLSLNPNVKELNFTYKRRRKEWEIDLSNNPDLVVIYPLCGLRIKKLDISDTGIKTLDCITRWGLKELDCSNSPISKLVGRPFLNSCEVINLSGSSLKMINQFYSLSKIKRLYLHGIDDITVPKVKSKQKVQVYVDKSLKADIDVDEAAENNFEFIFE